MSEQLETFLSGALSKSDLDACVALIKEGGAITDPETAAQSLPQCLFVVVKREGEQIIGVGAIKGERPWYARSIASKQKSGYQFDEKMHELGYVVVKESQQSKGYSKQITDKLLSLYPGKPLFATTSSGRMRETLEKRGFAQQGTSWPNRKGEPITLWIKL
jgi:hypothetical protein